MARTESLLGSGKIFDANKQNQGGIEVKYQLQVNGPDEASAGSDEWQGYMRVPIDSKIPGSKNSNPNPRIRYLLVLNDHDNRQGVIEIVQSVGKVGNFYNYGITGKNL